MSEESLSKALQENIITLLVFDTDTAPLIINNVDTGLFGNLQYREIAKRSIDFYKNYNEAPKEHIADLFDAELKDSGKKEIYTNILKALFENKDSVNKEYVLSSLDKFIRIQNLKLTARELIEAVQKDDIEKADNILTRSRNKQISVFDPGIFLIADMESTLGFTTRLESSNIYTGIKKLDDLEVCPAPKELFTFIARSGAGKTWFLVHLGKYALLQRKKILHITLELADWRTNARYMQSLFGISQKEKPDQKQNAVFKTDKFGNLIDVDLVDLVGIKSLRDKDIGKVIAEKAKRLMNPNLIVKEFPTGTLTVKALNAYLDNLESFYNFIPDIILLDYLDLMSIDTENMRIDLGKTAVDLRGLAVERNLAMVTVAQTNKAAEGRDVITRKHLAEDFSKVRVSDNVITYNQNKAEKELGIARLYLDKARNSVDGKSVLINQNYSIGQFCLTSWNVKMKDYFDLLKSKGYDV